MYAWAELDHAWVTNVKENYKHVVEVYVEYVRCCMSV